VNAFEAPGDDGTDSKHCAPLRFDSLAFGISHDNVHGAGAIIHDQHGATLKQFLSARADYRNHLLYATDAGSVDMAKASPLAQ
jgi:hypothetical protein